MRARPKQRTKRKGEYTSLHRKYHQEVMSTSDKRTKYPSQEESMSNNTMLPLTFYAANDEKIEQTRYEWIRKHQTGVLITYSNSFIVRAPSYSALLFYSLQYFERVISRRVHSSTTCHGSYPSHQLASCSDHSCA